MDMYFPTDLESSNVSAMIIAARNGTENVAGACGLSDHNLGSVNFGSVAQHYLIRHGKDPMEVDISKVKIKLIEILRQPEHGRLFVDESSPYPSAVYYPDESYFNKNHEFTDEGVAFGKDRVEAIVLVGNDVVRVVYDFVVIPHLPLQLAADQVSESQTDILCPNGFQWNISETSSNTFSFSDLSGSAVAQTTGTGALAQIVLDNDAAGHGWFVDYTPYLNEEWLPTSNPYEWAARPGSEAEGKIDLLSVLWHELGHAYGLEHTADSHRLMATTLQPGVRHLPSAEEWALLSPMLAGISAQPESSTPSPETPNPVPLPISVGLAAFLASRQRRNTEPAGITHFEVAANPEFTNTDFENSGDAWSTTGKVVFENGAATLKEVAESQTRLNQVFVIGENDKYLTLTLHNINLDDADNSPDDAFEIALIDANTGLSLFGSTGLTRNDALFNLQADGTEYKSEGVTTVRNADGTITVTIDLTHIPAGTVANLSFDLIGFTRVTRNLLASPLGLGSQVTVQNLRIGDSVPGNPDPGNPGNPDPNNPGTGGPGPSIPNIPDPWNPNNPNNPGNPATPGNPGTGNPTTPGNPDTSWNGDSGSGTDSGNGANGAGNWDTGSKAPGFWNSGTEASEAGSHNTQKADASTTDKAASTENHAPVISNRRLRVTQDKALSLDLLEGATDPDGDTLSVRILTQPRHGKLITNGDGTFTYIPDPGWLGEDTFTYRVNDGKLDSNTATVTIAVVLAEEEVANSGKSASITFQSTPPTAARPLPEYVYLRKGNATKDTEKETPDKPIIDWNGVPPFIAVAPLYLPAFLRKKEEEEELTPERLAEITGLKFPIAPEDQQKKKW